ncbi:MAG: 50S ribosomal protein L29 [Desulfobulbus sp.]|nr:MAG: 50S ribosomal protein L29 [Desulfobulbus sp.]RUM38961.1 MAG: 50S ribosomal protein L29 [Desulfobulbus sp.]
MKAAKLRELTGEDLLKKDRDLREDYFKLKFQHGIRKLENPARLTQLRKEIARVQTIITEQQA